MATVTNDAQKAGIRKTVIGLAVFAGVVFTWSMALVLMLISSMQGAPLSSLKTRLASLLNFCSTTLST